MNKVSLSGYIKDEPIVFPFKTESKAVTLAIPRENMDFEDRIECVIPDRLLPLIEVGEKRHFLGRLNTVMDSQGRKHVFVDVNQIFSGDLTFGENKVWYSGFLMKNRHFTKTVSDGRVFTMADVAGDYSKTESIYVPAMFWDVPWESIEATPIGVPYFITGKFQSRISKKDNRIVHHILVENYREGNHEKYQVKENAHRELQRNYFGGY